MYTFKTRFIHLVSEMRMFFSILFPVLLVISALCYGKRYGKSWLMCVPRPYPNARDNKCAPKDIDKPFAVVFTDVQASTRLWGKDPVEMSHPGFFFPNTDKLFTPFCAMLKSILVRKMTFPTYLKIPFPPNSIRIYLFIHLF